MTKNMKTRSFLHSHFTEVENSFKKAYVENLIIEKTYEPRHEISDNLVCATSKALDQPAHSRSLIRAYACRLNIL